MGPQFLLVGALIIACGGIRFSTTTNNTVCNMRDGFSDDAEYEIVALLMF